MAGSARYPVAPLEIVTSQALASTLFVEYDFRSRGLTLVAMLYSDFSAMLLITRAPPYGLGDVALVRFEGAGIVAECDRVMDNKPKATRALMPILPKVDC